SHWRDPGSGQEFRARLDTADSRAAYDAVRQWQEARRAGIDPQHQRDLFERQQELRSRMRVPQAADRIDPSGHSSPDGVDRHPESDELGRWDEQSRLERLPLVRGAEALQAVHDHVHATRSGFEFSGDPRMRRHAQALRPEPGVVTLALHGLRNGEVVVGGVRISADDFARGLAELHRSGRINLDGRRITLVSCFAASGQPPLASTLARHLGVEVTGATRQVWTYLDGRQVVASPDPRDGSRPTGPPDGTWVTYTPDGRATTRPSSDPRAGGTGPNPIAQAGGGGRAGEVLYRGGDGRLHAAGDPLGTHRTEDGHLHRDGDRRHTYRGPRTGRLHHEADAPGTDPTDRSHP